MDESGPKTGVRWNGWTYGMTNEASTHESNDFIVFLGFGVEE